MRKIDSITLNKLLLREFIDFIRMIVNFSKADAAFMAKCSQVVNQLEANVSRMEDIMTRHRLNLLTDDIQKADQERDDLYSYLRDLVRTLRANPDTEIQEAAKRLFKIIDSFGYVSKMKYPAETTALRALCHDLMEYHREDVQLIQQEAMVERLDSANEAFAQLYADRISSTSGFETNEMADAREKTEEAYRAYVEYVNARVTVFGDQEQDLLPVINLDNATISKFRTVSGQGANTPSASTGGSVSTGDGTGGETTNPGGGTGGNETPGGSTEPTKYTLTFTHNGQVVSTVQLAEGETVTPPTAPAGYQWSGCPSTMPARDVTVTTTAVSGGGNTPPSGGNTGEDQPF